MKQINFKGWITQVEYARIHKVKLSTVSQWVKRAKEGKGEPKISYLYIPELRATLVKRI